MMRAAWFSALLALACGGGLPNPSQTDAERGGARWPGLTLADLERGRTLYAGRCAACHQLYEPRSFSPQRWDLEVEKMSARARLSERQELEIRQYLVSVASRGGKETAQGQKNAQE